MHQAVKVTNRRPGLDTADLRLRQAEPASQPFLADRAVVVRMRAVGQRHQPDMLRGQRIAHLVGEPELRRQIRRGNDPLLVAAKADDATAPRVVGSHTSAAGAVAVFGIWASGGPRRVAALIGISVAGAYPAAPRKPGDSHRRGACRSYAVWHRPGMSGGGILGAGARSWP